MQLTDEQKKQITQAFITAIVTLALSIITILGYNVGLAPLLNQQDNFGVMGLQVQKFQSPVRFQQAVTADSTLAVTGASTFTGAATMGTANVTTLTVGGYTQSGAVRYGTAATYTSGTSITHGFAVTPTVCIISPMQNITSTYTITATGFSTNMQTTASPIYWFCGK